MVTKNHPEAHRRLSMSGISTPLKMNFMVTPCISNIQHINYQLTHTALKNAELLKHFKVLLIFKCFNNSTFFKVVCVSW